MRGEYRIRRRSIAKEASYFCQVLLRVIEPGLCASLAFCVLAQGAELSLKHPYMQEGTDKERVYAGANDGATSTIAESKVLKQQIIDQRNKISASVTGGYGSNLVPMFDLNNDGEFDSVDGVVAGMALKGGAQGATNLVDSKLQLHALGAGWESGFLDAPIRPDTEPYGRQSWRQLE